MRFPLLPTGLLSCLLCLVTTLAVAAEPPAALANWLSPQAWDKDTRGPVIELGKPEAFDDMHIFAPAVALEDGKYSLWYCGSRGTRSNRVFRLGLATGTDGKQFDRYAENPVLGFDDNQTSVLTPGLLRSGDGNAIRENGKLRMWFSGCAFGKSPLHTLHEATSDDGIHWSKPSEAQLENVYCPSVLKSDDGYQMWFVDVSKRPWVIRHATSPDGRKWHVLDPPVLGLSQPWEAEILVYPCVLKVDGTYLMWYGSYYSAVRRQTTAIGFAASTDGIHWHKHPQNPVLKPDPEKKWESHYVTSGCVMRLPDKSFRYWYASRTAPPFEHLYFAINTAHWGGPASAEQGKLLPLPPAKGDAGRLPQPVVDVLEVVDEKNAIIRAWVPAPADGAPGFVDLWLEIGSTAGMKVGNKFDLTQSYECVGTKNFGTTCGGRSVPAIVAAQVPETDPSRSTTQ